GRPITSDMVGPPTLVQKNALVVIEYATGPMLLTAKGKALDDGGKGEVVRVMNIDGSKLIQGVVTGADAVSVSF
ncbi:MAG: flagellar basal body P-ring formation chaperone FlgA, partial [Pseudomonadota bacterium]